MKMKKMFRTFKIFFNRTILYVHEREHPYKQASNHLFRNTSYRRRHRYSTHTMSRKELLCSPPPYYTEKTTKSFRRTNLTVKRLSFNRSQCGSCSTKYDTPTET